MLSLLSSVRARLFGLALLALVPLVGVFAWNAWQAREFGIARAKEDLSRFALVLALDLESDVAAARQLLRALGAHPDVIAGQEPGCGRVLRAQKKDSQRYVGFGVLDGAGRMLCHSAPTAPSGNFADREYFARAIETRQPVTGRPVISRRDGKAMVPIALPVAIGAGAVERVVTAGLDLEGFGKERMAGAVSTGIVLTLWEEDSGIILFRFPDGTEWVGKPFPNLELAKLAAGRKGTAETLGPDGVLRVYAFNPLEALPGTAVTLGISREALTGPADRVFLHSIAVLSLIVVAVLGLGWFLAERYLRRPLAVLDAAARRIGAGDFTVRVPAPNGGGELGHLLRSFNDTAAALEAKHAELRALNADLERRVAERTQQLEEANRAKSDFLANMSHELRTLLNSIIGFSEMLKDGVLGELGADQRRSVADIFDAGTHLLSLINDILDLSKVEAGMLQLEPGEVDVPALLKASTMVVREKALAHRIRLDTRLDPALGVMLGDERKLKQIVYNLLSNAVKFTPEGGAVTLYARRCARAEVALDPAWPGRLIALPSSDNVEFLAITVEDTGGGIAEEHLPKLFEPFVQVDSSATRRHAGTGLGLSLVRRLAELHGGTVAVASRPGAGSRFCVWLPYREVDFAMQTRRTAPEGTPPRAPAVPLALVIEDDDRIAETIAAELRANGFEVMRAATAEEGLVRAAKRRPQLIMLDIFLPAMDGWEFMRRLKANPVLADTPVVIISVSADGEHGLALGARRVLHKPFVRAELVAALADVIHPRPDGALARVLVVDDNVKAVEMLATALHAEGYSVLRAYGGAEAIEAARSALPDLVILDLMMPGVSGFEVARALRQSEDTARIPILVLTAKDLTPEDHARLNGNVSVILAKSGFDRSALLAELRRAIAARPAN